jgi:hypothetical protein
MSWIISHAISAVKSETPHGGLRLGLDYRESMRRRAYVDSHVVQVPSVGHGLPIGVQIPARYGSVVSAFCSPCPRRR